MTECVTGLDLVRLQILVAAGEPLAGGSPRGGHAGPRHRGPAIRRGPAAGLSRFRRDGSIAFALPQRRAFASIRRSARRPVISPYYDSMLAKVIVHAPTRHEAARRLSQALRVRKSTA